MPENKEQIRKYQKYENGWNFYFSEIENKKRSKVYERWDFHFSKFVKTRNLGMIGTFTFQNENKERPEI